MSNTYWRDRGFPWEYDPGPPRNRSWARLFARTPNYRGIGKAVLGREGFRWHFGPMFYRGRLKDNAVKVVVIGQEGAQDESLAHRSFTGGTGSRMQHLLNHIGISESYLFLNTFVYPIYGQYTGDLRWLAQDPDSPIVKHRHEVFDYVLKRNDVHLIVAVGTAAKESVVTWVKSHGGSCPSGARDVSRCSGGVLDPKTKIVGVLHPGGAGKGGSVAAIIADFKRAIGKIETWTKQDANWLPADPGATRNFTEPYRYRSAPIPFHDFPYGFPWRLGRGGTSSNRKDRQRSIQIYSAGGKYNATGARITYHNTCGGSPEGFAAAPEDVPYEPPRKRYRDYDPGPGRRFARLMMGGSAGLEWPDFEALGVTAHPSFGCGPIYRGRPRRAKVLVLADQGSYDDLFTGRALTGESGQHLQEFLSAMGINRSYIILRVLPVDTLDLRSSTVRAIVNHAQVRKVYSAIVDAVASASPSLTLLLTVGSHSAALASHVRPSGIQLVKLKAWGSSGALADWKRQLTKLKTLTYGKDIRKPSFKYDGGRGQIPRFDLPYGTLCWRGACGDRASRPYDQRTRKASRDYYKLYMPTWAANLKPEPLTRSEQRAVDKAP